MCSALAAAITKFGPRIDLAEGMLEGEHPDRLSERSATWLSGQHRVEMDRQPCGLRRLPARLASFKDDESSAIWHIGKRRAPMIRTGSAALERGIVVVVALLAATRGCSLLRRGLFRGTFFAAAFFAATFFAAAFFRPPGADGPAARRSAISSMARSRLSSSSESPRRSDAFVSPSVTYGPNRPERSVIILPARGVWPTSFADDAAWPNRRCFGWASSVERALEVDRQQLLLALEAA